MRMAPNAVQLRAFCEHKLFGYTSAKVMVLNYELSGSIKAGNF
jgi:hypothetical protein